MRMLTLEKLKQDATNFSLLIKNSYIDSYPEFVKYFKQIDTIGWHHMVIGSHFVYGWMPTIAAAKWF